MDASTRGTRAVRAARIPRGLTLLLLHAVLGEHVAAYLLIVVYESFSTLITVAVVAALVFPARLRDGYVFIASGLRVWILGVGSYYLIPSFGPFQSRPGQFAGLPHTMIQDTQARYLAQRSYLLAHPQAPRTPSPRCRRTRACTFGVALGRSFRPQASVAACQVHVRFGPSLLLSAPPRCRDPTERTAVSQPARILVLAEGAALTPELLDAIGTRASKGPTQFRLVVTNPAAAEVHLLHPERHQKAAEAEQHLADVLPALVAAAGGPVSGSVSVRHDPMDVVEDVLFNEPVDEIILAVSTHLLARLTHQDLAHRLAHYGLPVTTVGAEVTA